MDSMENSGLVPATRADLERVWICVQTDIESSRVGVKADVENLRIDVKTDIASLRTEMGLLEAKIDSSVRRLAKEIVDGRAETRELKEVVATKTDIKRFIDAVESFAGKAQSYDAAKVLHGHALTDVQVQMQDHERRITDLEARPH